MLNLTKTIEYGLIAIRHLNEHNDNVCSSKEISELYHIPKEIMAKTMQKLSKKGYLGVVKGPSGGYFLNSDLNLINLTNFIEDIEGPIGIVQCSSNDNCSLIDFCNIKSPINKVNENIRNALNKVSLYEITR